MNRRLREKALAEWRGLPQKPPREDRTVSAGDAVRKAMQSLGLKERLQEAEVLQFWKETVGDFIASHSCTPTGSKDGILWMCRWSSNAVHYELDRIWKPQILKKLKERFGTKVVRAIQFRVGG